MKLLSYTHSLLRLQTEKQQVDDTQRVMHCRDAVNAATTTTTIATTRHCLAAEDETDVPWLYGGLSHAGKRLLADWTARSCRGGASIALRANITIFEEI